MADSQGLFCAAGGMGFPVTEIMDGKWKMTQWLGAGRGVKKCPGVKNCIWSSSAGVLKPQSSTITGWSPLLSRKPRYGFSNNFYTLRNIQIGYKEKRLVWSPNLEVFKQFLSLILMHSLWKNIYKCLYM